jgi:hypothetical protein
MIITIYGHISLVSPPFYDGMNPRSLYGNNCLITSITLLGKVLRAKADVNKQNERGKVSPNTHRAAPCVSWYETSPGALPPACLPPCLLACLQTPLHFAAEYGCDNVLKELQTASPTNPSCILGSMPLSSNKSNPNAAVVSTRI